MRRAVALLGLTLSLLWGGASPAGAIGTEEFGIGSLDGRKLVLDLEAGRTTTTQLRVWNDSEAPVSVVLELVPATVEADGTASLEGDRAPVEWAALEHRRVELPAGEQRLVDLSVTGPDELTDARHTFAIRAESVPAPGAPRSSVLERVALVVHLDAHQGVAPGPTGLGLAPWVAGLLVAAVAGRTAQVRRNQSTVARSPAASATG